MSKHSLKIIKYFFTLICVGCIIYWSIKAHWAMVYFSVLWTLILWLTDIKNLFRDKKWYGKLRVVYHHNITKLISRLAITLYFLIALYGDISSHNENAEYWIYVLIFVLVWLHPVVNLISKLKKA